MVEILYTVRAGQSTQAAAQPLPSVPEHARGGELACEFRSPLSTMC